MKGRSDLTNTFFYSEDLWLFYEKRDYLKKFILNETKLLS